MALNVQLMIEVPLNRFHISTIQKKILPKIKKREISNHWVWILMGWDLWYGLDHSIKLGRLGWIRLGLNLINPNSTKK